MELLYLVFDKAENDELGNSLVESEVAIPSERKWARLRRIDRSVRYTSYIEKFNIR